VAKVVNCPCGETLTAENDDDLVAQAEAHVREKHPEMVSQMSREKILSMAQDA
jgi:hypothetical protein